jgi:hypothetical protein
MTAQKNRSHDRVTWQSRLDNASSEREVVSIAREFMAQFTPAEVNAVPENCRPGKIVDADDIARCAVELARYECQGDGETVISKLSTFFSSASERLSQLGSGGNGNGASRTAA